MLDFVSSFCVLPIFRLELKVRRGKDVSTLIKLCFTNFIFFVLALGQIKKISVFRVTGLKIFGRVGTHLFLNKFFFWKKYDFMFVERLFAFQMHKKKILQ